MFVARPNRLGDTDMPFRSGPCPSRTDYPTQLDPLRTDNPILPLSNRTDYPIPLFPSHADKPFLPKPARIAPTDQSRSSRSGPTNLIEEDTVSPRDYVQEMRRVIDQEAVGEYVSGLVAAEIVDKLRATDPDLLIGWMSAQAVPLVHQMINDRDRSRRTAARTGAPRSVFRQAAEQHEQGDPAPLAGLLATHYVVNGNDLRKPLGTMTAGDLTFVSADYRRRSDNLALEAAFFAALARKVGGGTVADHFTEAQLRTMRESLHG